MRSVTIKTLCDNNGAITTLGHPAAPLGDFPALQVRRVTNVPESVTDGAVVRLFGLTTILDTLDSPRLEIDYSLLGEGRIVR